MKTLNVEFAPRQPVPLWIWIVLASLLLALAAHQAWLAWNLTGKLKLAERESVELSGQLDRATQQRQEALARAHVELPYAQDAAAVARLAAFPIDRVLGSLEAAQVQGIKLTALDVSATEGSVKAELEFTDNDTLMHYLAELNAGEPKPRWRLIQAQTNAAAGAGNTASIGSTWADGGR